MYKVSTRVRGILVNFLEITQKAQSMFSCYNIVHVLHNTNICPPYWAWINQSLHANYYAFWYPEKKTDGKILESSCSSTGFTEFYSIMKSVLASYAWIYLFAIVRNTGYVKPGFFSPRKKHEIQCMLTHFQSVDGLTETTLTWNFKDIKPAMLPLELRCPNSYIPTPGPNSPAPQNMGSASNRVITEVIKDEVIALPWWSSG